jgi:hypothetical protein
MSGFRVDDRHGVPCKFRILGRGELAFVQVGERSLTFELLAGPAVIFAKSIRRWDDGTRVTEAERDDIIEVASRCLISIGATAVEVVR